LYDVNKDTKYPGTVMKRRCETQLTTRITVTASREKTVLAYGWVGGEKQSAGGLDSRAFLTEMGWARRSNLLHSLTRPHFSPNPSEKEINDFLFLFGKDGPKTNKGPNPLERAELRLQPILILIFDLFG
jgi:hypothetical protein